MNSIKNRELPVVEWDKLPLLLTEKQTEVIINISASALQKARCEGVTGSRTPMPPFIKIGGRIRYRLADIRMWVEQFEARGVI